MVAMTASGASYAAEDIKSAMGPYCMSTKVLPASFFPNCPSACPRSVWTLEVPRQIFFVAAHYTLWALSCTSWASSGSLLQAQFCGEQDPKCVMGCIKMCLDIMDLFGEKIIPQDGVGQGQTCKKRSTEQHFCTACNKDPLLI
jgi:hypothetical protein